MAATIVVTQTDVDAVIPAVDVSAESQPERFQWTQQWYPVAVAEFLDPKKPHAIQLLGLDLVLWRDGQQRWHCFADACPHRLAPLSEGRVEADGSLLCAYHAWRFEGDGTCIHIPQARDPETEARHRANPKACAIAYPIQEQQGLLWVWPDASPQATERSQNRSPRLVPELELPPDRIVKTYWYVRDLPYGWDYFMENVADPAHVPVSHHGIMGSRYEAAYYNMHRLKESSVQDGIAFNITPTPANIKQASHDFLPPCHMRIVTEFEDGGRFILALYASPSRPGWCRQIGCQVLVKNEAGKPPKGLGFFALPMPKWLGHILSPLFLHQDLVFLHYQEQQMARRSAQPWLQQVYTPNPQDKMVIAFRKWFTHQAGGKIPWACDPTLPPAQRDKQVLFDLWSTHTQDCLVCQRALRNIQRARMLAYALAIVCAAVGLVLDARAVAVHAALMAQPTSLWLMPPLGFWVAIATAIILGATGYGLQKLSRLFYVYEFEHAHND